MPKGIYVRKPRRPKEYPPEMVDEVKALYSANHTQVEIAAQIGTTQKVVWRLMRHHNIAPRPRIKRDQWGKKNAAWKGADAKYSALHLRVGALRGKPRKCEVCGEDSPARKYEWASLTGRWDDPSDYKRMCCTCHKRYDRIHLNLGAYARRKGVVPNARKD